MQALGLDAKQVAVNGRRGGLGRDKVGLQGNAAPSLQVGELLLMRVRQVLEVIRS